MNVQQSLKTLQFQRRYFTSLSCCGRITCDVGGKPSCLVSWCPPLRPPREPSLRKIATETFHATQSSCPLRYGTGSKRIPPREGWRCTRYVALHPNRRGAMPTDRVHDPRHKLTCGPARKDVHVPDRLGWARRRSPISWLDPGAAGPDRPSRRRAERAARDARAA